MEHPLPANIMNFLQDLQNSQEPYVRKVAAERLGELKMIDDRVINSLKTAAQSDTNKYVRDAAEKALVDLGIVRDEPLLPQSPPKFDELTNYLWNSRGYGISRTLLIVGPLFGWIILGLPTLGVFSSLGKRGIGLMYLIPYNILGLVASYIISDPWGDYDEALPWILVTVVGLYIAAWVHINVLVSRFQSAARQRIDEIEHQAEIGIDSILEKGLLYRVLQEK